MDPLGELIGQLAREAVGLLPGHTAVRLAGDPATDEQPETDSRFYDELRRSFEKMPDLFAAGADLAYLGGEESTDGKDTGRPTTDDADLRAWWELEFERLVLLGETVGADVVAARAQRLVEREASTQLSAAHTAGVTAAAARKGWVLVFVPERDACLVCTSYAGAIVEPGGSFAAVRNFTAGELGEVMCPAHPWCRCSAKAMSRRDAVRFADPLEREAERSVLRFDALPSESDRARTEAARRLIDSGTRLAKTVVSRSAAGVKRRDKVSAKREADRIKARDKRRAVAARAKAARARKRAPLLKRKQALEQELRRLRQREKLLKRKQALERKIERLRTT